ncbi:MAG TPA: hypothetical protein VFG68_09930 [Fimbriiglobus sp.]|nr:hypothetical protein [Fimbriiglobus sp.]
MNYTVAWRREAEDQFTALWIRSVDKNAMTGYMDQIDRILGRDPHDQGESRNENTRLAFFRPLVVRYQIDEATMTVTVVSIKWVGR